MTNYCLKIQNFDLFNVNYYFKNNNNIFSLISETHPIDTYFLLNLSYLATAYWKLHRPQISKIDFVSEYSIRSFNTHFKCLQDAVHET